MATIKHDVGLHTGSCQSFERSPSIPTESYGGMQLNGTDGSSIQPFIHPSCMPEIRQTVNQHPQLDGNLGNLDNGKVRQDTETSNMKPFLRMHGREEHEKSNQSSRPNKSLEGRDSTGDHLPKSSSDEPTRFYSSMDYDLSVPFKYVNGKQVPPNGEIDIEVHVEPTSNCTDHTIHKKSRSVARAYRSELVVQLGTKKGKSYQSNRSNRDVFKDCDVTEEKTLGITCLRVEHDTHIPVDVVVANDSDQKVGWKEPVADRDSYNGKSRTYPPRLNGYSTNISPVHVSPGHDYVPMVVKPLMTTGHRQMSQDRSNDRSMSNTIIERRRMELVSNDTIVNSDRTNIKYVDSNHYINAKFNSNSQYLLQHAKDSADAPSYDHVSLNFNSIHDATTGAHEFDEWRYGKSLEEIHSVLKETYYSMDKINGPMDDNRDECEQGLIVKQVTVDGNRNITNEEGLIPDVELGSTGEDLTGEQSSTNHSRVITDDYRNITDNNRGSTHDDRSRADDESCPTDYSRVATEFFPRTIIDDGRCSTDNDLSRRNEKPSSTDHSRVAADITQTIADTKCGTTHNDLSKSTDSQVSADVTRTITDLKYGSTHNGFSKPTNEPNSTDGYGRVTGDKYHSRTYNEQGSTDCSQLTTGDGQVVNDHCQSRADDSTDDDRESDGERDSTDDERELTDDERNSTDVERCSTYDEQCPSDDERYSTDNEGDKTDDERCSTDYERDTTDDERDSTDDERDSTDNELYSTDNERGKIDNKRGSTNDDRSRTDSKNDSTDYLQVETDEERIETDGDRCVADDLSRTDDNVLGSTDRLRGITNDTTRVSIEYCRGIYDDKRAETDDDRGRTACSTSVTENTQIQNGRTLLESDDQQNIMEFESVQNVNEEVIDREEKMKEEVNYIPNIRYNGDFSTHADLKSQNDTNPLVNVAKVDRWNISSEFSLHGNDHVTRRQEETHNSVEQTDIIFPAKEHKPSADWTEVNTLSRTCNDVKTSQNVMSDTDNYKIGFTNSDIKTDLMDSARLYKTDCNDEVTYTSKEETIEQVEMECNIEQTTPPVVFENLTKSRCVLSEQFTDALKTDHEPKQTDKKKVSGSTEGSLDESQNCGTSCIPAATTESEAETLCKQKTYNGALPVEDFTSDSDSSVHSKICTSDSGYPMTIFSVESMENDSTDTEFESTREDVDTDKTEDFNDSSESEYETASSNFKCSDVSEYENDVDEELKMPRPVVTIDVEMVTPPEFAFRPQGRVVEQGSTAKFICVLKGCPKPEVTWFKNGIILRNSEKYKSYEGIENMFVLEVTEIDSSDVGEYVCTASNSEGRIYASAELTIEDPPLPIEQQQEPFFMERLQDVTTSTGMDVRFSCQVGGNPAPQILWFHNGVGLNRFQRFTFSRSDTGMCTLSMPGVKPDDEGEVACIASNILGRATCCAYLNIKDSSKTSEGDHIDTNSSNSVDQNGSATHYSRPDVQNIVAIEGTTTKFKCSVIGNPKPSVVWHKDGRAIDPSVREGRHYRILEDGYTHTLEISKTQKSDAGHYFCTVSNKTGAIVCSCLLLVNDRKDNSHVVDSVISPMTISTKVETTPRTIEKELIQMTTVDSKVRIATKVTIDTNKRIEDNAQNFESSENQHESSVLLLKLQRDDKIGGSSGNEVTNNGAILKGVNGKSQSDNTCNVKLSDNVTLQCISPGMNINTTFANNPQDEKCVETKVIIDNPKQDDCTEHKVDDSITHPFCVEKKFMINGEANQNKFDIKIVPIKSAKHSEYICQRSYDGDATDDSSDSTDQLLHSLQMKQNLVEVDSDDEILNVGSYQYSTSRTRYNHTPDSEGDMERAIRLSDKVDSCIDIVNTVLNLASLDSEGEKELRMRLDELRSGLSSSGSSIIDDQESFGNIKTLSMSGSNCNTPLSMEDNILSIDLKDTGQVDPPDLDDDISDIESLNRSSSSVNLKHVSSPLKDQRIQSRRQDPKFPEMAADLLDISNPYEMIKEAESNNKDSPVQMMADVLSSQIVIEGLSDYSMSKHNTHNQNAGKQKMVTNIRTRSNTRYLKNVGSFADNVVAEILIDAALRIKDVTQSRNRYQTKEKSEYSNVKGTRASRSHLPQQFLNELIKVVSETSAETNNIALEIFHDILHETMRQEVVSNVLETSVPEEVRWISKNLMEDTLPNIEQTDFQIPLRQTVVDSIYSTKVNAVINKNGLQKVNDAEKQCEMPSINSEILDRYEETPLTLPEPMVPIVTFTQDTEVQEPASANLNKVKARNILSGFLGSAMLHEQHKLKPTVKLARSQSDRIPRPMLSLPDKLKRNSTDPEALLKRSLSVKGWQGKKSNEEDLEQTDSDMSSPVEPKHDILFNLKQADDEEEELKHTDNETTSSVEPINIILPIVKDVLNLEKEEDLKHTVSEITVPEKVTNNKVEHNSLPNIMDEYNSLQEPERSSTDQQQIITPKEEEPMIVLSEDQGINLESIKEANNENVESKCVPSDIKHESRTTLSRSMSARIPIRRKSHSFIRKDPRYLSWQAQNSQNQKNDTGTGQPRVVPNRTQSFVLPRIQFGNDQIVEEKEIRQSAIDIIPNEQKCDINNEAIDICNDTSVLSMEKQNIKEKNEEPTIDNNSILDNHVTKPSGQQLYDHVKMISKQEKQDEFVSGKKLTVTRTVSGNKRKRPISSLINMFETTIQSNPRSSKVQEFGLTFKNDEDKKSKPVNRSQSMMCRRTENVVTRKAGNRLSMDGSVHLNQLESLIVPIDIMKTDSSDLENVESELDKKISKKPCNNNNESITGSIRTESVDSLEQEDDDVFSLPIIEDSSCDEDLSDFKTKSTSQSEKSLSSLQSSSEFSGFEGAPTFIETFSSVEVQDGDSARLEVKVVGNPEPEIRWFKDGNELPEDQHYQYVLDEDDTWSLILAEATPADAGEYTCLAENCHGSVSCTGYFKVEDDVATVTEDELSSELGDSSRSNSRDTKTVARLLKEHQQKRLRNGSLSTSGAEEEMFCRYIVLDNYQDDRLDIRQGDEVEVLESQSDERWLIKHVDNSSMIGYIPVSFLEKLDEDETVQSKRNSVKLAIQELFPDIVNTTETMQEKKLKRKISAKERLLTMRQYSDQDDGRESFDMCVAIASYVPDEDDVDHIPLVEGQYVEILDSDGATEWLVQTKPSKVNPLRRGWVPASHLMKDGGTMIPGQTESLNRMISRVILDESDADLAGTKKQEALIKRGYVLEELLQTERTFVKNMLFCIESYLPLLDDQNAPPSVKGKKDVLFLNFEKICDFHKNIFVKELEECGNDAYSVGRAFIKWQCNFEYHVQYCKNKPKSESSLTPAIKACFDDYLRSQGIVDKFSLSDYLIKPVQRITKYQLLLKEVVKYSSRAKEDCIELEMALNVMMQVPKRANDLMHISLIEGFQGNINDLGKLYRQEDYTVWTGKQKGRGKERHVFLFKDLIMLTKIKKDPRSEGFTYAYKNHMTIPGIGMTEESRDERCFELWYGKASSSLSMTLQAKTKYVKEAWVKEIRSLLEQKQMEMLEAKASVERIYGALHQTRSSIRSASSISSLNSEPGTLSNSSQLSKSSESLTFNEPSTSSLGATSSLSVPGRLHGDSFTSLDSDSPPRDDYEELEIGALYEISDDFIAGGMCGLELSKGELVKLVETENNNVCVVQSMPSPGCCTGEEGSVPPYLLRRRKSLEAPVCIEEKPETISVNVGEIATFTCTYTGMPAPIADWYFKGHVIKGQSSMNADNGLWVSSVTIPNVTEEDGGKYRCVIGNASSTKSCTAHLHVAYVWGNQSNTTIDSSDDALLEFDDDTLTSLPDNSPSITINQPKPNHFKISSTTNDIHNNNVNTTAGSNDQIGYPGECWFSSYQMKSIQ